MSGIVEKIASELASLDFAFTKPPVLVGGNAMEYYGLRAAGDDVDLIVDGADYEALAGKYPELRKDILGDLGVTPGKFEIWRSIALLDYDWYSENAVDLGGFLVISFEKLMFTRVIARDVKKYADDLQLMVDAVYAACTNEAYRETAMYRAAAYAKSPVVFGGKYVDDPDFYSDGEVKLALTKAVGWDSAQNRSPEYRFDALRASDGAKIGECLLKTWHNEDTRANGNIRIDIIEPRLEENIIGILARLAKNEGMRYYYVGGERREL